MGIHTAANQFGCRCIHCSIRFSSLLTVDRRNFVRQCEKEKYE